MAAYYDLEVFRAAYRLLVELYRDMPRMPRDIRYTILQKIQETALSVLVNIFVANSLRDRRTVLTSAQNDCMSIKIMLRVLHDLHHLSDSLYFRLSAVAEEVSKQLAGWLRYSNRKLAESKKISVPDAHLD